MNRTLSFFAALFVLYCEFLGSNKADSLLLGIYLETYLSNAYNCRLIGLFLVNLVQDPRETQNLLNSLSSNSTESVIYLDVSQNTSAQFTLQSSCTESIDVDFLYDIQYIKPVVAQTLHGFGIDLTRTWFLVDCTFDGRLFSDSSMLFVYLIDHEVTSITTLLIQTIQINRPKQHHTFMGGVATFTTTPLHSLHLSLDGVSVISNSTATYSFAIGFDFPYEMTPFERINVDELVPHNGLWQGTIASSKERFSFCGIDGFYRDALGIQSAYAYYYWDLPSNPIQYMTAVQFQSLDFFYDTWGWFRCFLGIGIATSLTIDTVVALLVMYNVYRTNKILWIPDIYPAIQRLAMLRALLLFIDCWIGSWWRVYQIALIQGNYRLGLLDAPSLKEITQVDGLMVCLGVTFVTASWLHVRVHLVFVVVSYLLCFEYRIEIVNQIGISLEQANNFLYESFENYLVVNENRMSLWTVYECNGINMLLIITESTWLILAIGISIVYVIAIRLRSRDRSNRVGPSFVHVVAQRRSFVSFRHTESTHWSKRSMLYGPLQPQDNDYTSFERSVGMVVGYVFGFVASTVDYEVISSKIFVSRNGVWLLGYVVIDGRFAIQIEDYPLFVLNSLLRSSIFQVYGFIIQENGTSIHQHKLPWQDFNLKQALLAVSLIPLA